MGFWEHIHSKPQHVRARYPFFFATGITAVVALIWITALPTHFATDVSKVTEGATNNALNNILETTKTQVANTIEGASEVKQDIETSNMNALTVENTTLDKGEAEIVEDETQDESPPPSSDDTTQTQNTSTTSVHTYKNPEPRVILIGTTTPQE